MSSYTWSIYDISHVGYTYEMEQLLVFRNREYKVTQPLGIRVSFSQFCELSELVIEVLTKIWKELGFLANVLLA